APRPRAAASDRMAFPLPRTRRLAAARLGLRPLYRRRLVERQRRAAPGEDTVMGREVADEIEVWRKARVGQHAPAIAAHREHLAALDDVMRVELEGLVLLGNAATIDDRLAV